MEWGLGDICWRILENNVDFGEEKGIESDFLDIKHNHGFIDCCQ